MDKDLEHTEEPMLEKETKKEERVSKKEKKNQKSLNEDALEKLQKENAELNDKILRISAEMQNIRRHKDEEISKILKYDGEDFIKQILPVIDNFERAIGMDDDNLEDELSKFLEGFKMIYGNLYSILERYDVKEITCLEQDFDPACMEAVLTEHLEDQPENIVLDVLQKGYIYKDKVIRPAMVKVNN